MKLIKSLILIVTLTGATYAGEMVQPVSPPLPAPQSATAIALKQVLVGFVQSLLTLR